MNHQTYQQKRDKILDHLRKDYGIEYDKSKTTDIPMMEAAQAIDELVLEVIGLNKLHVQLREPTHGTCCTCQVCGLPYEDCPEDTFEVQNELLAEQRAIVKGGN